MGKRFSKDKNIYLHGSNSNDMWKGMSLRQQTEKHSSQDFDRGWEQAVFIDLTG